jgi:hypothetical protein
MLFLESFPSLTNTFYFRVLPLLRTVKNKNKNFPENLCLSAVANDGAKPNRLTACHYDKFVARQKHGMTFESSEQLRRRKYVKTKTTVLFFSSAAFYDDHKLRNEIRYISHLWNVWRILSFGGFPDCVRVWGFLYSVDEESFVNVHSHPHPLRGSIKAFPAKRILKTNKKI